MAHGTMVSRAPKAAGLLAADGVGARTGTYATKRTAWLSQSAWLLGLIWARLDSNQGPTDYESAALTS